MWCRKTNTSYSSKNEGKSCNGERLMTSVSGNIPNGNSKQNKNIQIKIPVLCPHHLVLLLL